MLHSMKRTKPGRAVPGTRPAASWSISARSTSDAIDFDSRCSTLICSRRRSFCSVVFDESNQNIALQSSPVHTSRDTIAHAHEPREERLKRRV